jgi:hypothetical protein
MSCIGFIGLGSRTAPTVAVIENLSGSHEV